jgi:hypothetical protein
MRLLAALGLACCLTSPVLAQSATPAPVSPASAAPISVAAPPLNSLLAVPVPANARVRLDLDTRGDDLLGILKNFLKGFNGNNILGSLDATRAARAPKPGVLQQGPVTPSTALTNLANEADLGLLLKDVNHVHLVVMEVAPGTPHTALNRTPGDLASPGLIAADLQTSVKMMSFYEEAFDSEGGHRIIWADGDSTARVLMVGFSPAAGYALVIQAPGALVVLRTDGYPDPESIGPLMSLSAAQVSATISEIMDKIPPSVWKDTH